MESATAIPANFIERNAAPLPLRSITANRGRTTVPEYTRKLVADARKTRPSGKPLSRTVRPSRSICSARSRRPILVEVIHASSDSTLVTGFCDMAAGSQNPRCKDQM